MIVAIVVDNVHEARQIMTAIEERGDEVGLGQIYLGDQPLTEMLFAAKVRHSQKEVCRLIMEEIERRMLPHGYIDNSGGPIGEDFDYPRFVFCTETERDAVLLRMIA